MIFFNFVFFTKSSLGYSNLALIYTKLINQDLALENYLKAYEIDPKNKSTSSTLARVHKMRLMVIIQKSDLVK